MIVHGRVPRHRSYDGHRGRDAADGRVRLPDRSNMKSITITITIIITIPMTMVMHYYYCHY